MNPSLSPLSTPARTWCLPLVLLIAAAMQTTWLAHLEIVWARLDLPLLCAVSVALLLGWEAGAAFGLAAGLLSGFCIGSNVGSWGFSRLVVGGLIGLSEARLSRDNPLAPPACAALAVLTADFIFYVMSPTDFATLPLGLLLLREGVKMALHAAAIWPVHALIERLVLPPRRGRFG